jgi:hypothetical protein
MSSLLASIDGFLVLDVANSLFQGLANTKVQQKFKTIALNNTKQKTEK